ncbi:MAG: hypothetical protein FE036_02825 [Thermoplasmata archaeon]|nr:MAG: hypothetical protein FE036_02825 [Thermoplasmata archaeon]
MKINKIWLTLGLITTGVISRIWLRSLLPAAPHFYIHLANASYPIFMIDAFFIVATLSLIAGRYIGKYGFIIPLSIMAISDIYFGGGLILLFTWTGFAMMAFIGYRTKSRSFSTYFGFGLLSVLAYDIWTNFGSWLGWYPHTIDGFILCYTVAIPFMLWHILSTMIALPLASLPFEYVKEHKLEEAKPSAVYEGMR